MDIFATHRDITQDESDYIHHRFSHLLKEKPRYQVVEPVLPKDILGIYTILPEVKP